MSAAPAPDLARPEVAVHIAETAGLGATTLGQGATRATVQLHGEMDMSNAALLTGIVAEQIGLGRSFIRLDVSRLAFVDCAGLRAIVGAHNCCLGARGTLVLTGVTPRIARLLAITCLDEALFVADGRGDPSGADST